MANNTIIASIQFKRGTAQRWIEVNPVLQQGEPGFEYDTHKLKIGDGVTHWVDLKYVGGEGQVTGKEEIISVQTYSNLPKQGNSTYLYRVISDKMLYQWDDQNQKYEALGGQGSFDPSIITLINGGNANG